MMRLTRDRRLLLAALAIILWLPHAPPALAGATPDDPVVADVVRMLDAGIESRLIRSWLESGGKRPGILSANDMIALSAADAPDELIEYLLDSATQTSAAASAQQAPMATPAPSTTQAPSAIPTPSAVPTPSAAPATVAAPAPSTRAAADTDGTDCCLVDFSVEYRAPAQQFETDADMPGGDLFLYVDGRFAGRFESRGTIAGRGAKSFKRRLSPGEHRIRLTRELHAVSKNRGAGDARDHRTIVSPSSIVFDVQPNAQWNMDIRWAQSVFSLNDPLTWRWSRNGEKVAGAKKVGAAQDNWPFLCDDIEISHASGAIADWRAEDRSRNCVTWASLWSTDVTTDRAGILAEFRKEDYQPNVSSIGRID